jgi:ABC-2 type transport system ATP-binding protein
VGTLIETPEMYPSLTPREALMMIAETRGVPRSERTHRIEESLAEVRMGEWIDKRVGKFSKGMKQRVCVAAAILSDPIIVILDEPTIGLDPRGMSEVRDIVKSLKKKNRLIFMSSHILSEVADVCDEVAMIDHGKLLVYDTLPNVTAKFSGGTNLVEAAFARPIEPQVLSTTLPGIGGVTKVERIDDRTVRIQFAGGLVAQQSILTDLVRANLGLLSYKPAASALEEVYLNLIADSR